MTIMGYRAFKVLQLTRPHLTGQKAFQSDIALKTGPFALYKVRLGKEVYKHNLLASFGISAELFRGKGAGT